MMSETENSGHDNKKRFQDYSRQLWRNSFIPEHKVACYPNKTAKVYGQPNPAMC